MFFLFSGNGPWLSLFLRIPIAYFEMTSYVGRWLEGVILGFIAIPADLVLFSAYCLTVTNNHLGEKFIFSACEHSFGVMSGLLGFQ